MIPQQPDAQMQPTPPQAGQQPTQPQPNPVQIIQQHILQIHQQADQQIQQLQQAVTIDRVLKFLQDERTRSFAIEIETDSTIMPDEAAEKQSRNEFLGAFSQASAGVQQLLQLGPSGAELAGGLLKFALAPYRVGRQLDGLIEKFTEQAPQIVQQQMQAQQGGPDPAAAQMQQQMAQMEQQKIQLQAQKAQADAQLAAAKLQMEQAKAQEDAQHKQQRLQLDWQRMQTELQQGNATLAETLARVEHVKAETVALLENAQTSRQAAINDTVRTASAVGQQQFEQDQALAQPQVMPNEQA
ncbi:hypothetical protein [Acetobacter cerevisiae]|uniref:hypothetical protein n=1 Tax=Acetobacter cerevisiae TaxID=178900 RepID=UPI00209E1E9F|nr:hypothetical protein [Acetobacter cerevisiae]MCP1270555.1 hypothetical protein [Acetobacter cerevisiae]MCP1278509.1 hypothetical protein [Acetobacter cerevisiae]